MKKSGEDKPGAPAAPMPTELVCEIADEGKLVRWNTAWAELVDSVCGVHALVAMESGDSILFDLVHSDDVVKLIAKLELVRAESNAITTVFRVHGRDDVSVEMRWSRLHHAGDGKTWVGVGNALRVGRTTASALVAGSAETLNRHAHAAAMNSMELAAFASAASHDLRAPLRAIHGFSEIVCEDYADALDGTGNDYLQRIVFAARRLSRTIDGVTDYLRLDGEGRSFGTVDLNPILQEVAEVHQSDDAPVPGTVSCECLPLVLGDSIQLRMLLQELVTNGLVHNQAKMPAVSVTQKLPEAEHDRVVNAGRVSILVSDNGVGVRAKDREAIFSPFRKMAPVDIGSGMGLGLAIARRIAQRHGGELQCLGGEGAGCQFVFDLQVVSTQEA